MLRITRDRVTISQERMRRLAARAIRLMAKYAGVDAVFAALAVMLVAAAERYVVAFDNRTAGQNKQKKEGHWAIDQLAVAVHRWLTLLPLDAPDLASTYTSRRVPDDVIAKAKRLVADLGAPRPTTEAPIPYADAAIEQLNALIPAAEAAWAKARVEQAQAQERKQELRAAGLAAAPARRVSEVAARSRWSSPRRLPSSAPGASAGDDR